MAAIESSEPTGVDDGIQAAADGPGGAQHGPKLRSRKRGAAIALSDLDKRLLNLMQGQFPIALRPYQHVAVEAGITEDETMRRVTTLLDERIIRQVTPIFDTRALGYSVDAGCGEGRPRAPVARGQRDQRPSRASPTTTCETTSSTSGSRSRPSRTPPLGIAGNARRARRRIAGAESVRQLPTLKLFKIRMDLEMEAGTETLATAAQAAAPAEIEPQPYDEFDRAVIRALQGDMPVISEPYAPAAAALGIGQERLLEHLRGMQERRLLRRVAAILFHRRAGFSANGMGVWKVPDERIMELGMRMASFRGISHCYQRPTYPDWPYSVFTMAHGRSKEECDAILDSIAADTGIGERATLYSSTEFKKIRLLYFTGEYRAWEREHAGV